MCVLDIKLTGPNDPYFWPNFELFGKHSDWTEWCWSWRCVNVVRSIEGLWLWAKECAAECLPVCAKYYGDVLATLTKGEATGPLALCNNNGDLSPSLCDIGKCTEVLTLAEFGVWSSLNWWGALVCEQGIWITSEKLAGVNELLHVTGALLKLFGDRKMHVTGIKPV